MADRFVLIEIARGAKELIRMEGNQTILNPPDVERASSRATEKKPYIFSFGESESPLSSKAQSLGMTTGGVGWMGNELMPRREHRGKRRVKTVSLPSMLTLHTRRQIILVSWIEG